jgi:hypothetical protein
MDLSDYRHFSGDIFPDTLWYGIKTHQIPFKTDLPHLSPILAEIYLSEKKETCSEI